MISEWIAAILLIFGALFMLVAGLGLLRFEDFYLRIHAATKAPSLGVFLMLAALMVYYKDLWLTIEGILIIIFIFITTPIGSHMLSRVAHLTGVKQSKKTIMDEMPESKKKNSFQANAEKNNPGKSDFMNS